MLGKGASSLSDEAIESVVGFGFIRLLVLLKNYSEFPMGCMLGTPAEIGIKVYKPGDTYL